MALTFKEIESFKFGDLEVKPQLTAELKLRVRSLTMKEENEPEIRGVLASCFGDKAAEVKAFMERNLCLMDYVQIQVYLTQGQNGLDRMNAQMSKLMEKSLEKSLAEKGENE